MTREEWKALPCRGCPTCAIRDSELTRVFARRLTRHWADILTDPGFADALAAFALAERTD